MPRSRAKRAHKPANATAAARAGGHLEREKIHISEAGLRLGLTERRLRQLITAHRDVPVVGQGREMQFLWPELREWRDKQLVQQGVQSVRPDSVEEARRRQISADADLKEMEVALRRGSLMPAALYRQELEAAFLRVKAHQQNAAARYTPQVLSALADRLRADDALRVEELIRRMMQDQMAELESGDDVPEDEEATA